MSTSITIVGGCGHIGLPLGIAFARAGRTVTLVDTDAERVATVSAGRMPFREAGADALLPEALASGRLTATTDPDAIGTAEVVVITLGTPIDEFLTPDVHGFDTAVASVLERMRAGQLLVLRSTLYPGLTERLARRAGRLGIEVANCPERISQGDALEELPRLPQIVGGTTPEAAERAEALFSALGAEVIQLPPIEAELAKLFANAYRYLNFAISNQFYGMALRFGADFDRVHEAVTRNYPRLSGFAKAGFTAGPCLLKDTMQLAAFDHMPFALGHAAMIVNESLPSTVVEEVKRRYRLADATAGILGMAFKGDSDDPRSSLAYKLRKVLELECRRVLCTDPYIDDPDFLPLETVVRQADILFVGAPHRQYRALPRELVIVDVFSAFGRSGL